MTVGVFLMERKILFVGNSAAFLVNSIQNELKEAGFEVSNVSQNLNTISNLEDIPHNIFINVDEVTARNKELFVYLRDLCSEESKKMYFLGYPDEIESILDLIPNDVLGGVFKRPLNASDVVKKLFQSIAEGAFEDMKKHILVVDDSGTMLRTIKGWLEPKYRVSLANSATSAITFLASQEPDLILLDYEMPVCSGPMMLEMIRSEANTEDIPVIFLTGNGDKESVENVLTLKPQGYLLKTMPPDKIVSTIDMFFLKERSKKL